QPASVAAASAGGGGGGGASGSPGASSSPSVPTIPSGGSGIVAPTGGAESGSAAPGDGGLASASFGRNGVSSGQRPFLRLQTSGRSFTNDESSLRSLDEYLNYVESHQLIADTETISFAYQEIDGNVTRVVRVR